MAQQVPSAEVATEHSTPAGVVERESDAEPVREITEEVRNEDVTIGDASVQGNKQQKDTSAALAGTVLEGRYELVEVLGAGGMGIVYRARHLAIGNDLAIKVLRSPLVADNQIATRFLQEARFASSIRHPNVVPIFDYGEAPNGAPYYVMDMLRGKTLGDAIDEATLGSVQDIINLSIQISEGLKAAHSVNIIHRDLKPDNIFLEPSADGKVQAKIIDFGIARLQGSARRLTLEGAVVGTPAYMGPEQARGMRVDFRTDLYAVGVMMFEMLTGRLPFQAKNSMAALASQVYERPPTLSQIKAELRPYKRLEAVIEQLLEKDPNNRVQSAEALLSLLRGLGDEVETTGSSGGVRQEKDTVSMGSGDLRNAAREEFGGGAAARDPARRAPATEGGFESTFPPADTFAPGGALEGFVERDSDLELERSDTDSFDDSLLDPELARALGMGRNPVVRGVTIVAFIVLGIMIVAITVRFVAEGGVLEDAGARAGAQPPGQPVSADEEGGEVNAPARATEGTASPPPVDGQVISGTAPDAKSDSASGAEDLAPSVKPEGADTTGEASTDGRVLRDETKQAATEAPAPTKRPRKPKKRRSKPKKPLPEPPPREVSEPADEPKTQAPAPKEKPPSVGFDDLKDPFS